MAPGPFNVLFLCTGNSARSVMAEALLRHLGGERFGAFSAGSRPLGAVNPLALQVLGRAGVETAGLYSKGFEAFQGSRAPALNLVVTVCDSAAADPCPIWPGAPAHARWSLPDPAAVTGAVEERRHAFEVTLAALRDRLNALIALIARIDRPPRPESLDALARDVSAIGEMLARPSAESRHG